MNNESGHLISSSITPHRGRTLGVPKKCVCGHRVVELISKLDLNPYRRYYRCAYAVTNKLKKNNHTFKWVDEAYLNEIESLAVRISRLEEHKTEIENMVFEKIQ
ncbi:unnamed protein product [Cochlearia groenlandica]